MSLYTRRHALMRRLWNEGDSSFTDIAAEAGTSVDTVEKYLARQPGYPGIIRARVVTCANPGCGKEFQIWGRGHSNRHCSLWCREEARRAQYRRSTARRRACARGERWRPDGSENGR